MINTNLRIRSPDLFQERFQGSDHLLAKGRGSIGRIFGIDHCRKDSPARKNEKKGERGREKSKPHA